MAPADIYKNKLLKRNHSRLLFSGRFIKLVFSHRYFLNSAGGDNISVTGGVVSRVEPTRYVHGAAHLMAIQIDAAINPGNSGGPALMEDKVVGVAFQNLANAENIGYVIAPSNGSNDCFNYEAFVNFRLS